MPVAEFSIGRAFPGVAPIRPENNRQEVVHSTRFDRSASVTDRRRAPTILTQPAGPREALWVTTYLECR